MNKGYERKGKVRVVVATVVLVLAAVVVTVFIRQYYLPMRNAKPVLKMLERGTPGDLDAAARSMYNNKLHLREPGVGKVQQAVLNALANTTDEERFFLMFRIIGSGQESGNLLFKGEKEWDIIKAATERNNAIPGVVRRFFVVTDTNGLNWLSFQLPPIP